jgi:hypothetical protein
MGLGRRCNRGFRRGRIGNVAYDCDAADLGGDGFGKLAVEIAYRNPGALRGKLARRGGAQSGCTPGDDGGMIPQLHGFLLEKSFF